MRSWLLALGRNSTLLALGRNSTLLALGRSHICLWQITRMFVADQICGVGALGISWQHPIHLRNSQNTPNMAGSYEKSCTIHGFVVTVSPSYTSFPNPSLNVPNVWQCRTCDGICHMCRDGSWHLSATHPVLRKSATYKCLGAQQAWPLLYKSRVISHLRAANQS
jgi:hypothetical protein